MKFVQRLLLKSTYSTSNSWSLFLTGSLYFDNSKDNPLEKNKKKHRRIHSNTPVIGATGIEQSAKDPQKQGLFDNAENATTYFTTYRNYFEQIIDLFDRLTPDEQTALLDALRGRIQTPAK